MKFLMFTSRSSAIAAQNIQILNYITFWHKSQLLKTPLIIGFLCVSNVEIDGMCRIGM